MRQRDSAHFAEIWNGRLLPTLVLTASILLAALPTPFDRAPLPDPVLTAVYLACVCRPASVPPLLLFGLGLLHDLLSFTPIGLHAFVYVLVYALSQRLPVDDSRILSLWLGFVPVVALAGLASWFAVSLHHLIWLAPDPVLARAAASFVTFPVLAFPLLWVLESHNDEA